MTIKKYGNWKQIQEGRDICPRCKIGILGYKTSEDAFLNDYTCDRCNAKFRYEDKSE